MSDHTLDTIGKTLQGGERRDAVHFAVAPVMAGGFLKAGEKVNFAPGSTETVVSAGYEGPHVGIIDPFLEDHYVSQGDRCWMFLLPNTITGLRHEWSHPAFENRAPEPVKLDTAKDYSEHWLRGFAERYRGEYDGMVAAAVNGESYCFGEDITYEDFYANAEFWEHIENVTGQKFSASKRESNNNFRCAC